MAVLTHAMKLPEPCRNHLKKAGCRRLGRASGRQIMERHGEVATRVSQGQLHLLLCLSSKICRCALYKYSTGTTCLSYNILLYKASLPSLYVNALSSVKRFRLHLHREVLSFKAPVDMPTYPIKGARLQQSVIPIPSPWGTTFPLQPEYWRSAVQLSFGTATPYATLQLQVLYNQWQNID